MTIDEVKLTFRGRFEPASFAEFARHRARRLSVDLADLSQGQDGAQMRVTGQRDLVDAFEMALSLGPADCIIIDVRRDVIAAGDGLGKEATE